MPSPNVLDVNQSNFQSEVIQRSFKEPVIVDFWAPWCGPCRMLGPLLERLANETNSGFILAKLNTDENPQLAGQYDIRGIPAVKAFRDGKVIDGFVGAQPEANVRQFMQRIAPMSGTAHKQPEQPAADTAPQSPDAMLQLAREHLMRGRGCEALNLLKQLEAAEAESLLPVATFLCDAAQGRTLPGGSAVASDMQQAAGALQQREQAAALYSLLVAYNQAVGSDRDAVGKVMKSVFALLGETSAVTKQYSAYLQPS